jgi:hypothetical protein
MFITIGNLLHYILKQVIVFFGVQELPSVLHEIPRIIIFTTRDTTKYHIYYTRYERGTTKYHIYYTRYHEVLYQLNNDYYGTLPYIGYTTVLCAVMY